MAEHTTHMTAARVNGECFARAPWNSRLVPMMVTMATTTAYSAQPPVAARSAQVPVASSTPPDRAAAPSWAAADGSGWTPARSTARAGGRAWPDRARAVGSFHDAQTRATATLDALHIFGRAPDL